MELRAERTEFTDAIAWTTRTVAARATLPALAGVLLDARDGRLTCRATDLELAAEVSVPVRIDEPGTALLPGRLLGQLVSRLPDAPVDISGGGDRVTLRCGRATFGVRGMPADDFPQLPQPAEDAPRGIVKAEPFVRMVGQVARAASPDEARPVLTGVKLEGSDDRLTAAATDSYRLAVREVAWDRGVAAEALVPARALSESSRAASERGAEVTIVFEDGQASFLFGDRRLTTRLIEGNFPEYRQLLPTGYETRVTVDRALLHDALQRVAVVALGQTNTPVMMRFEDGTVELTAGAQEVGDATESLPAEVDGEGLSIAFNPMFLVAGIEAAGTEQVVIELRDGLKPAVVKPHSNDGGEEFIYLLMPVRTNN
ncbi:MAG: DNA polymerase III subunit beta [Actinobacteria bacterium]|nr:DNA polymerase III subunit beta [Actinomycetota bacterium]